MRITRLHLTRFGMFTDVEFGLLPRGVNVVVGANEAGKTTAMAAIQQLLYGIPVRSLRVTFMACRTCALVPPYKTRRAPISRW